MKRLQRLKRLLCVIGFHHFKRDGHRFRECTRCKGQQMWSFYYHDWRWV